MPATEGKTHRTRDDVEAGIRAFTVAHWARLHFIAKSFAFKTSWDLEDLLQEAIVRTLQGSRKCPIDVDLMKHLIDTMSSVANGEREKAS